MKVEYAEQHHVWECICLRVVIALDVSLPIYRGLQPKYNHKLISPRSVGIFLRRGHENMPDSGS